MLPKQDRLNLKRNYSFVTGGKRLEGLNLKLSFRFGSNNQPLIGIAVSAKIFKKAVDRNRARRIISKGLEGIYQHLPPAINIVAVPKNGILKRSSFEVIKEVEELVRKFQSSNAKYQTKSK